MDADIAAMRELGKDIADAKPDLAIVIGSDHLETFFLSSVPTFAVVAGEKSHAHFAARHWDVPVHLPFADCPARKAGGSADSTWRIRRMRFWAIPSRPCMNG